MIEFNPHSGAAIAEIDVTTQTIKAEGLRKTLLAEAANFKDEKFPLLTEWQKMHPRTIHATHKTSGLVRRFDINKNIHYLRELMGLHWRVATPAEAEKLLNEEKLFSEELRIKTEKAFELETMRVQNLAMETLARTMQSLPSKEEKKGK